MIITNIITNGDRHFSKNPPCLDFTFKLFLRMKAVQALKRAIVVARTPGLPLSKRHPAPGSSWIAAPKRPRCW